MKRTRILALAVVAAALTTGCKGITKSFLGSEGGDSGVISIDSTSVYGKHTLRSMNPLPGHSVLMHPDGTMEMRWVGTNGAPNASPRGQAVPQRWMIPLVPHPFAQPVPATSGP